MVRLKTKVGNSTIEFEGQSLKDVCKFSAVIGMLPVKCDACDSSEIHLTHKNPGGNDYYGLRCRCGAELNFHQRKEGGGFYVKADDKFKVWSGESKTPEADNFEDDDVPF